MPCDLKRASCSGDIARCAGNGVRHDINAGRDHRLHAGLVLRMGEHRLALRMGDIDRGFGDGDVHVHDRLVAHVRAGEKLDAVEAHSEIVARHLRGFVRRGGFGELQLGWQIGGMAALREDAAGKQDVGTQHFARVDAPAQRQRVSRVGAEIPYGGETPARQHLLHVFGAATLPVRWPAFLHAASREMNVAVPEAGDDGLAGAIDDARIARDLDFAAAADRGDDAAGATNHRIRERRRVGRRDRAASDERECLRVGCALMR